MRQTQNMENEYEYITKSKQTNFKTPFDLNSAIMDN